MEDSDQGVSSTDLLPIVYAELHRLASRIMQGERADHTLQPTALLHEAYMRISGPDAALFADRLHFQRVAARAMRQVLVDHARKLCRDKRRHSRARVAIEDQIAESNELDLLMLDEAMEQLAQHDPELTKIVELRFFAGMKHREIARVLGQSLRTVERGWALARAWLSRELADGEIDAE